MKTFEVKVYRDGKWWMIEIPEIEGLTQARRLGEVEDMARSFIAVDQDLAPSDIALQNPRVIVAGDDLGSTMQEILDLRATAKKAEEQVAVLMVETARKLANAEVPLRDIGSVLDVSHQRVHQLLHSGVPVNSVPSPGKPVGNASPRRGDRPSAAPSPSDRHVPRAPSKKVSGRPTPAPAARGSKARRNVKG